MKRSLVTVTALALMVAAAGCNTTPTKDGAVLGGLLGGGLGAVVGNQSGHAGEGALIGAAAGAITGAAIGDAKKQGIRAQQQQVYREPAYVERPVQPQERVVRGHYETRIVETPTGETYEERVFVPHK